MKLPGGGQRTLCRVMVRISCKVPSLPERNGPSLHLVTTADRFWSAEVGDRPEPFVLNADHVRQWIVAHKTYLQRIAEDTKFENSTVG